MAVQTSAWRGRRVLVTGVTGFLGSAVMHELLAHGAEVVGLVHQQPAAALVESPLSGRVRFVHGRADNVFRLHSAMAVHEVAAVFHLASCDTSALLQAVNMYSRRVPVVAARPILQLAIARMEEHEERLSIVRFGEVFGPGDHKLNRAVPAAAAALHSGKPVTSTDGPARDFVFIRDAAYACLLAAETSAASGPGEYTFRSGWLMTDRQIAATLREVSTSRPIQVPHSAPVTNPLGWQPAQSFSDALSETLTWYRKYFQTDSIRAAA